jgi:FtsH-binding integral membrane protein
VRRRLGHLLGTGLVAAATVNSVVRENIVGAVFFGAATILLIWFAVRPKPSRDRTVHPFRMFVAAALAASLCAAFVLATAISAPSIGQNTGGLAVVGAVVTVPVAGLAWWAVYLVWRKGIRWSSTTTRAELERLREK